MFYIVIQSGFVGPFQCRLRRDGEIIGQWQGMTVRGHRADEIATSGTGYQFVGVSRPVERDRSGKRMNRWRFSGDVR
jgi:hypothetical protein